MIMGIGHESGLTAVPDAIFVRSILAAFMSTMFIPGMELWACAADIASAIKKVCFQIICFGQTKSLATDKHR
jgi:hypothetical protein